MAVTAADVAGGNGFSDATATSYLTGSVTPTAGSVVWLAVALRQTDPTQPTQPTITGLGGTWTFVTSIYYDTSSTRAELYLFRCVGHTGAAGQVTVDPGVNHVGCVWNLSESFGVDTSTPVVAGQVVTVAADQANNTVTLPSAPTAGNATMSFIALYEPTVTQEGGHALLGQGGPAAGNSNLSVAADFVEPGDQTHTWTFLTATHGIVVVELAAGAAGGTLDYSIVGGQTADGIQVAARLVGATDATLKCATNSGLTAGVVTSGAETPDGNGHAQFALTGLLADTVYFYGVEVDSQTSDAGLRGTFRTLPPVDTPHSFTFTHGSCVDTITATAAQDALDETRTQRQPLFHIWHGDLGYDDATADGAMRSGYDTKLGDATFAQFVREVPWYYSYSDHDFLGNNVGGDENGTTQAQRLVRAQAVRDYFPLPNLGDAAADGPVYYSWRVGRLLFVQPDERWNKSANGATDNASKVMWGSTQRTWFSGLLAATSARVLVLCHDTPWQAAVVGGEDDWGGYSTERTTIADIIDAAGLPTVHLHGDAHALVAADTSVSNGLDFTTAQAGSVPTFVAGAAALQQTGSLKGGPYRIARLGTTPQQSQGEGRYGEIVVTDTGSQITLSWTGRNATSPTASSVLVPTDGAPLELVVAAAGETATVTDAVGVVDAASAQVDRFINITKTLTVTT